MAITYEEALATLEAMFGHPWTRETLDAVLRHEKGHMENTCDRILSHGDKAPQLLISSLQNQTSIDETLARQFQQQQGGSGSGMGSSSSSAPPVPTRRGRGTPTELPGGFLRIPGYKYPPNRTIRGGGMTNSAVAGGGGAMMDDETLARMLQDELFSEELARNPDFAHLARRSAAGGVPPGQRRPGASTAQDRAGRPANPMEGVNVMENLSKLGEGARRRLQMFAVNFENRLNGRNMQTNPSSSTPGILQPDAGAVAERRGLLDDSGEEEEIEFEMREKKSK